MSASRWLSRLFGFAHNNSTLTGTMIRSVVRPEIVSGPFCGRRPTKDAATNFHSVGFFRVRDLSDLRLRTLKKRRPGPTASFVFLRIQGQPQVKQASFSELSWRLAGTPRQRGPAAAVVSVVSVVPATNRLRSARFGFQFRR